MNIFKRFCLYYLKNKMPEIENKIEVCNFFILTKIYFISILTKQKQRSFWYTYNSKHDKKRPYNCEYNEKSFWIEKRVNGDRHFRVIWVLRFCFIFCVKQIDQRLVVHWIWYLFSKLNGLFEKQHANCIVLLKNQNLT